MQTKIIAQGPRRPRPSYRRPMDTSRHPVGPCDSYWKPKDAPGRPVGPGDSYWKPKDAPGRPVGPAQETATDNIIQGLDHTLVIYAIWEIPQAPPVFRMLLFCTPDLISRTSNRTFYLAVSKSATGAAVGAWRTPAVEMGPRLPINGL